MKAGKEHFGQHRTKSASTSFNIAESLWEHTPPLEGRGRAVRRKVNGRVTGWNPLSLREGEGAGGETGKRPAKTFLIFSILSLRLKERRHYQRKSHGGRDAPGAGSQAAGEHSQKALFVDGFPHAL